MAESSGSLGATLAGGVSGDLGAEDVQARLTPTGLQSRARLARRRWILAALCFATTAAILGLAWYVLGGEKPGALNYAILAAVALSAPWTVLAFWSAAIGFILAHLSGSAERSIACVLKDDDHAEPIEARVAVLMTIRNEDADRVYQRLSALRLDLDRGGYGAQFDFHILSDSSQGDAIAKEESVFLEHRDPLRGEGRVFYRRRARNEGFKAGNIREWLDRVGDDYDFMVTLDADSVMCARLIERMTRAMARHPQLGLLQSLVAGMPSKSVFARLFQFGARVSSRLFAIGSAWWQADCGPYWGHNAIIRVDAFKQHCVLPKLSGSPPFGGPILSHDQLEAALLRRAGYEVRLAPVETGSWEEYPVTLLDFLQREQRWCNGNLQYAQLLGTPGLVWTNRFLLLQAVMMYVAPVAWMAMLLLAAVKGLDLAFSQTPDWLAMDGVGAGRLFPADVDGLRFTLGVGLFAAMFLMSMAPKIIGALSIALSSGGVAKNGGVGRFAGGFALESVFSILLAPVAAMHITIVVARLLMGRGAGWGSQARDAYDLSWESALSALWPQVAIGAALTIVFALVDPVLLVWGAPVLLGLIFAPWLAVVTSRRAIGGWMDRRKICGSQEEFSPPSAHTLLRIPGERAAG